MLKSRPEDKPKVIALSIGVLAAFVFIGTTMFKFGGEKKEEIKRTRNSNLMLQIPTITESAGSMIMWRTAKWPIPDPFRAVGGSYERPASPPPANSYRPPTQISDGPKPLKPNVRGLQPIIVLKGVILSDSGLGDMAVFAAGDLTKTMRVGQLVVPGVYLTGITSEGASIKDLGKTVQLSVNESYKPTE